MCWDADLRRDKAMKKSEIRDYMIVETGYEDGRYLVMGKSIVDDEMKGFSLDDFDENLVHKKEKPYSISKVYEAVKITFPFELNVEDIFTKQTPKLLWKREPMPVSKRVLERMDKKQMQKYLSNIVYPCVIVD
jgi:hypothetical protein